MVFSFLWKRFSSEQKKARDLYDSIVEQARQPSFYIDFAVPDTVDGRFDMLCAHIYLVVDRLRNDEEKTKNLAQSLYDIMFADMDSCLREIGVGDMSVGKRIKDMAFGLNGRLYAYDAGLKSEGEEADKMLRDVIRRNIYGTIEKDPDLETLQTLAQYFRKEHKALAQQEDKDLLNGKITFGPAPQR